MTPASLPGPSLTGFAIPAQNSGPIRVPPLSPERAADYARLFDHAGNQDGLLKGMAHLRYPYCR
jgi:epidermal growth factor receptor substrate 15